MKKYILILILLFCDRALSQANIQLSGSIGVSGNVPILGTTSIVYSTDANLTMSYSQASAKFLIVTSNVSLTTTRNLVAPLTPGQEFNIKNSTTGGQSITITGNTGTGISIPNGSTIGVLCDGTNYIITNNNYTLPKATNSILGGVKPDGTSCTTDSDGILTCAGAGGGITALTNDVTASGTGSVVATLATVNSAPGACGDSTHVCQITTNEKGLTTAQTPVSISGGGSGGSTLPESLITQGGGVYFIGDSISFAGSDAVGCTSPDTDCNEVGRLLKTAYGGIGTVAPRELPGYPNPPAPYSQTYGYGDSMQVDCLNMQILPYFDPGDSASPDVYDQCSSTRSGCSGFGCLGPSSTITNDLSAHQAATTTLVGWASPRSAKLYASNSIACTTPTGTWTSDDDFHPGVAIQTIVPGATLACTTPNPVSKAMIAAWHVYSGGSATATFSVDGTVIDTWNSGAAGTIETVPGSTSFWWSKVYDHSNTTVFDGAPAVHTLLVTVTAAGDGNPFSVAFFTSPEPKQNWLGFVWPHIFIAGVPMLQGDTPATGGVDALNQTIASQLAADGWKTKFVDLRDAWPDSSTVFTGGTYPDGRVCTASTVGNPHPGTCGHLFSAWAYLKAAGKQPHHQVVDSFAGRTGDIVPQTGDYTAAQVTNAAVRNGSNNFNGQQTIIPSSNTAVGAVIQGNSSPMIPALIQHATGNGSSPVTASPSVNFTSGNVLLVTVAGCVGVVPTISDTLGNTFTPILPLPVGGNGSMFISTGITGGAPDVISVTADCGTMGIVADEIYGIAGSTDGFMVTDGNLPSGTITNTFSSSNGDFIFTAFTKREYFIVISLPVADYTLDLASTYYTSNIKTAWKISSTNGTESTAWDYDPNPYGSSPMDAYSIAFHPKSSTNQIADLTQWKTSNGIIISGVNGNGFPFITPLTFAALPSCTTGCNSGSCEGSSAIVTDSSTATLGDTVTNGGSYHIKAYCDGTNWTVEAK